MSIDQKELLAKVPTQLLIDGQWRDASSGETFNVENPATGATIATLSSANSSDAVAALDAACAAVPGAKPRRPAIDSRYCGVHSRNGER